MLQINSLQKVNTSIVLLNVLKSKNGEPAGQNILFTKVSWCCSICPTQDFSGSLSFTQNKSRKMFVSKPKVGKYRVMFVS